MNNYIIHCYQKGVSCQTIARILSKKISDIVHVILIYKNDNQLKDFYKLKRNDFIKKYGSFDFNVLSKKVTYMNLPTRRIVRGLEINYEDRKC